jgi:hypothetical protein
MTDTNTYLRESEKAIFPGYSQKKHSEIQRELEKTERMKQKVKTREEKRKCSLPPFLMVRAGVLNPLLGAMLSAGMLSAALINHNYEKFPRGDILVSGLFVTLAITFVFGQAYARSYAASMREDINTISDKLNEFLSTNNSNTTLDLDTTQVKFPKLISLMTRHFAKNNPGVFDKLIANPQSVQDMNVAENIILGHLSKSPTSAQLVLDTFSETTIPEKVYKKATRYAERLKRHEQTK